MPEHADLEGLSLAVARLNQLPGLGLEPFQAGTQDVQNSIFLGMSGIYLWYFLKQERKIGLVLMTAGLVGLALVLVPLLG